MSSVGSLLLNQNALHSPTSIVTLLLERERERERERGGGGGGREVGREGGREGGSEGGRERERGSIVTHLGSFTDSVNTLWALKLHLEYR